MSILPGVGFLGVTYPWVLAGHVIFVIFLMASLFMIPRYFVYHYKTEPGSPEDFLWIQRERRMKNIIMNPSLALVWIFGLMLAFHTGAWSEGWFHAKLLLVIFLSGFHGWLLSYSRKLSEGQRPWTEKRLRMLNEIPAALVSFIVILVIVRPF